MKIFSRIGLFIIFTFFVGGIAFFTWKADVSEKEYLASLTQEDLSRFEVMADSLSQLEGNEILLLDNGDYLLVQYTNIRTRQVVLHDHFCGIQNIHLDEKRDVLSVKEVFHPENTLAHNQASGEFIRQGRQ